MHAISRSPPETNCAKCVMQLESEGLKCSRCTAWMHLRCSDLPIYMLLRLKTSQASYVCRGCVLKEGNESSLKEAEEYIETIMQKEKEATESAAEASILLENSQSIGDGSTPQQVENSKSVNTCENDPKIDESGNLASSTKKPTCKFFLRRSCKHGRRGTACKFDHPKLCFKYTKNGDMKGGCKAGSQCKYVHPKLCSSYRTGVCKRKNCSFYHVHNAKIQTKSSPIDSTSLDPCLSRSIPERSENRQPEAPPAPTRIFQRSQNAYEATYPPNNGPESQPGLVTQQDFLELKSQMKMFQETLQLILVGRTPMLGLDRAPPARAAGWGQQ